MSVFTIDGIFNTPCTVNTIYVNTIYVMSGHPRRILNLHNLQPQQSITDPISLQVCSMCWKPGVLLSVCQCKDLQYHQSCILGFIRSHLLRLFSRKETVDVSEVSCSRCKRRIPFAYRQHFCYDCTHTPLCTRYTVGMLGMLIILLTTLILSVYIFPHKGEGVLAGFVIGFIVEGSLTLILLWGCVLKHIRIRQIVLTRVIEIFQREGTNSSSEDNTLVRTDEIIVERE